MSNTTSSDISVASDFYYNNADRSPYGKQGHTCCHCCCDTRRAAMILNFMNLLGCFLLIGGVFCVSNDFMAVDQWFDQAREAVQDLDDDDLQKDFHLLVDEYAWVAYTFLGIGMVVSMIAMEGAYRYRARVVFVCALWYIVQGLASLFFLGWGGIGILWAGLWAYPSIMLYQEIIEGIMVEDNYHVNEKYSCCCVENPHGNMTIRHAIENRLGIFS